MIGKTVRILVFRGGAIGDFILTLPALQALRKNWPEAYIELAGYPHIAGLGVAGGIVNQVHSLDRAEYARFFAPQAEFPERQIEYIRSFDLIVSYLYDPDSIFQDNLLCAGARQLIYGNPIVSQGHAVEHLLKPLETLAIYETAAFPQLQLAPAYREAGQQWLAARELKKNVVAIHPGSGSPSKNWPLQNFIELARRLKTEQGLNPVFLLGEADGLVAAALKVAPEFPVVTGLNLTELAGVLAACRAYVGNDSGITHLAAALGIPVVALFGPTDSIRWGPRGPNVQVLSAPGGSLDALQVVEVLDRLVL